MAVAILGWPVNKIPTEVAQQVIKGAQNICNKAGIPLAGGHSVDTQEPLFGLAVTGLVKKEHIKKNNAVRENDIVYITKPLGIGVLSTALKKRITKRNGLSITIRTNHHTKFDWRKTRSINLCECYYRCDWIWFCWPFIRNVSRY